MSKNTNAEFTGSLKQYSVALKMQDDHGPLEIYVEDRNSFERWSRTIDKQFINDQDYFFRDTFYSTKRLFGFLTENFDTILIEDGSFRFDYGVIDKKTVSVRIELVKQEIERTELVERKMGKLDEQLRQANNRMQLYVNVLLCLFVFVFFFTIYCSQSQKEELLEELKQIRMEYRTNISLLISLQQQLALNQKRTDDSHSQQIRKLAGQLRMIDSIGNHPENSHKYYYSVTTTSAKSAKISKTSPDGWHNFVNKFAIHPQIGQTRYKVKLNKIRAEVLIGFTTSKGFGVMNNFYSAESVYYWSFSSGCLYDQGQYKQLVGAGANVDDTVEIVADFVAGKFEWLKNGAKLVECIIPASMKDKPIYLSINTYHNGNEVEVSN